MHVKDGASIALLVPPLRLALDLIEPYYAALGAECVVASGDERTTTHKGRPVAGDTEDPHYVGKAVDLRMRNVPVELRATLVRRVAEELGCPDGPYTSADGAIVYSGPDLVIRWEYRGTDREHLHLQQGKVASG